MVGGRVSGGREGMDFTRDSMDSESLSVLEFYGQSIRLQ